MKKTILYLILVNTISLILIVFLFVQQKNIINKLIDNTNQTEESEYIITTTNLDELNNYDAYLLYYHKQGCSSCSVVDEMMEAYIEKGYFNYLPVFFVEDLSLLVFDEVKNVPTVFYFQKNKELIKKESVDEIYELLDQIVQEAN